MSGKYFPQDIWDAIKTLNPNQPVELGKEHVFAFIIPTILALEDARDFVEVKKSINISRNIARNRLRIAYYDLAVMGHFDYFEEDAGED